jgi:F-type H+-transporting ATPase subunit epsilon
MTRSPGGEQVPANKILLEIVTPKGRALHTTCDEVTAPSVGGEFGVLPGHLPILASVRTGIVTYRQGNDTKKCAVGTGFVEAGANQLLLLTDEFTERDAIDPVIVRRELAEVQLKIAKLEASLDAQSKPDYFEEKKALIERENWLAAELELYGDPPPPTMRPYEEYGPPAPVEDSDVPATDTETKE